MSRQERGSPSDMLRYVPRPVNITSLDFEQFNFRLIFSAQVWMLVSSIALVDELTAGTITYVLSANLTVALPSCTGWRSDAVTINYAEPKEEPCIILAKMSVSYEMPPLSLVQCEWLLKKSLIQMNMASRRARRAIFSIRVACLRLAVSKALLKTSANIRTSGWVF